MVFLLSGIGLEEGDDTGEESRSAKFSEGARWSDVEGSVASGPFKAAEAAKNFRKGQRLSVKDLANEMIAACEGTSAEEKVYSKLLLPNERVVYDSFVWKRAVSFNRVACIPRTDHCLCVLGAVIQVSNIDPYQ
jgi:hypothetical protein